MRICQMFVEKYRMSAGKNRKCLRAAKVEKQSIRMHSKTQSTAVYTRQDNGPARQGTD